MPTDRDDISVLELVTLDRLVVDTGTVGTFQIFDQVHGVDLGHPCVVGRDGRILDHEVIVRVPADRQTVRGDLTLIRTLVMEFDQESGSLCHSLLHAILPRVGFNLLVAGITVATVRSASPLAYRAR